MIAALYVRTNGPYFQTEGVDPWDEKRDARKYNGPHAVIAHPPCQRWGKFYAGSPSVIRKTGKRKKPGDDDGCFQHAIETARRFGGVVEHPWGSKAWPTFNINTPPRHGGWIFADHYGGWTCCVEQGQYGHYARKPTLLVTYGIWPLPDLKWANTKWNPSKEQIERYGEEKARRIGEMSFKGGGTDSAIRIDTPQEFKELLIDLARSVEPRLLERPVNSSTSTSDRSCLGTAHCSRTDRAV